MRRILSAVLLAAMLAFSLVPAYAAPGTGEGQYGRLQEAVDAACLSGEQRLLDGLAMRFTANASQIAAERTHMEQLLQQTLSGADATHFEGQQLARWLESYTDQCED